MSHAVLRLVPVIQDPLLATGVGGFQLKTLGANKLTPNFYSCSKDLYPCYSMPLLSVSSLQAFCKLGMPPRCPQ